MDMQLSNSTNWPALLLVSTIPINLVEVNTYAQVDITKDSPDIFILDDQNKIGIDTIRDIKEFLKTRPLHLETKTVVIMSAHRMNPVSQNALLKILEEPPSYAQILLETTNPYQLLPTIQSRLHQLVHRQSQDNPDLTAAQQLEFLTIDPLGQRLIALETLTTKDQLTSSLHQLILTLRQRLYIQPSRQVLYNLTLCLYCWQMLNANVNPKSIVDYLGVRWVSL